MSNKHTPAPWYVYQNNRHGVQYFAIGYTTTTRDCSIADAIAPVNLINLQNVKSRNTEGEANARLIAAAPEMLAALRLAYDQLDCTCQSEHVDQDMIDAHEVCRLVLEKVQS